MNPQFKTINGTLCIMLEKPEPLTKDAKFPCVVRLIQDDSPMGGYNKTMETAYTLRRTVTALRVFSDSNVEAKDILLPAGNYNRFEILGYPVVEGSAEWALYQMQQGKKVLFKEAVGDVYWALNDNKNVQYYNMGYLGYIGTIREQDVFLENIAKCMPTGWQLYEPKPEHPAINGYNRYDYIPVEGIKQPKPKPCPDHKIQNCDPLSLSITDLTEIIGLCLFNLAGKKGEPSSSCFEGIENKLKDMLVAISGTGIEQPEKHLLSNAKTGDKVRIRNGDIHILMVRKNYHTLGHDYWACDNIRSHDIDGCYLCSKEKNPYDIVELLPELKVGDWVRSDEGDGVIEDIPLTMPDVRMTDGRLLSFHAEDLKVIKPSEVVVDFGSGIKGRIHHDKESWGFVVLDEHNDWIAQIGFDNLSEPKKSLVEKLLKAQEEE